jgi:DNA-binding SARP family transcriptional activator/tetratricopeptide (TPR) repeat protein
VTVRLQLLGPVEAYAEGLRIKIGPRKQRLVLAILALEVNRPVEVFRIVDLVWPREPPRTAEHAVRVCVSALRAAFAGLSGLEIQTSGSGYVMVTDPMTIDVHLFRWLVTQATSAHDDVSRVRLLRRALDLWRGPPLGDTAPPETWQRLMAGLMETRLAAQEDLIEARLRLGGHRDLLDELTSLVEEHPQRERLVRQLMLALYRSGRRSEALAAYRRTREWLAEELGLDPGEDLRRLELAILRGDPGIASPAPPAGSSSDDADESRAAEITARIVGRAAELHRLDSLLAAAYRGESRSLVVRGVPGIGKTMLLDYLATRGKDLWVLRACGVEFEFELPFSGLLALLLPVLGLLDELPHDQAQAVRIALAMTSGASVDRLATYVAVLNLLVLAAGRQPLLCLVDDAHWLDRASADTLLFIARRTASEHVSVVFTARDVPGFAAPGIPELTLTGLDVAAGVDLAMRSAEMAPQVAARLVGATAGNPLALIELPAVLTAAQRSGQVPLDQPVATAGRVEAAFLEQVRPLSATARQALLTCVLCDGGDMGLLSSALAADGLELPALDAVIEAGLVAIRDGKALVRHPLVRSAVYSAAGPGQRRAAHLCLAAALNQADDADRRAWHLASAAFDRDEEAAAALVATAERARQRGGVVAQARALERAAQLTENDVDRARRLYEAAVAWVQAGAVDHAAQLYQEVLRFSRDPTWRAKTLGGSAYLQFSRGAGAEARDKFVAEAESYAAHDPLAAGRLMSLAMNYDVMRLNAPAMLRICARAAELACPGGSIRGYPAAAVRLAYAQVLNGLPEGAALARTCIPVMEQEQEQDTSQGDGTELAEVLTWLEDYDRASELFDADIAAARRDNDVLLLAYALPLLAALWLRLGRLRDARVAATEAVDIAELIGQPWQRCHALATLAMADALLGDEAGCRRDAERARRANASDAFYDAEAKVRYALGMVALGAGRPGDAVGEFEWVAERLRSGGIAEPNFLPVAGDLVEALIQIGHRADARLVHERFQNQADRAARRGCQATAARGAALLAADRDYTAAFEYALTLHSETGSPLERARTLLWFGRRLDQDGHPREGGARLNEALATFEKIGAVGWARQCRGGR